jgi:hypothetical protein
VAKAIERGLVLVRPIEPLPQTGDDRLDARGLLRPEANRIAHRFQLSGKAAIGSKPYDGGNGERPKETEPGHKEGQRRDAEQHHPARRDQRGKQPDGICDERKAQAAHESRPRSASPVRPSPAP